MDTNPCRKSRQSCSQTGASTSVRAPKSWERHLAIAWMVNTRRSPPYKPFLRGCSREGGVCDFADAPLARIWSHLPGPCLKNAALDEVRDAPHAVKTASLGRAFVHWLWRGVFSLADLFGFPQWQPCDRRRIRCLERRPRSPRWPGATISYFCREQG